MYLHILPLEVGTCAALHTSSARGTESKPRSLEARELPLKQSIVATHAACLIREIAHSLHIGLETCLNYSRIESGLENRAKWVWPSTQIYTLNSS